MDINRFTEKAQQALQAAQSKAARFSHQQIDVEHLLAALLEQDGGLAPAILNKANVRVEELAQQLERELDRLPKVSGPSGAPEQIYVTGRLNRLLAQAEDEAKRLKDEYISVEHLLLALTDDGGGAGRLFKQYGISRERLAQADPCRRAGGPVAVQADQAHLGERTALTVPAGDGRDDVQGPIGRRVKASVSGRFRGLLAPFHERGAPRDRALTDLDVLQRRLHRLVREVLLAKDV